MRAERAQNRACRCAARCGGNANASKCSKRFARATVQLSAYAPALNPLLAIRSEIAGA